MLSTLEGNSLTSLQQWICGSNESVLRVHARDVMEEHLSASQFAYREGVSCANALLLIQHKVNKYLDTQECRGITFICNVL